MNGVFDKKAFANDLLVLFPPQETEVAKLEIDPEKTRAVGEFLAAIEQAHQEAAKSTLTFSAA